MNQEFGRLRADGTLERVGKTIVYQGVLMCNPSMAMLRRAKCLPINDTPPEEPAPAGSHYEISSWHEQDGKFVPVWDVVPDDPAPAPATRTFDVYRLMLALKDIDVPGDPDTGTPSTTAKDIAVAWAHEHGVYEELMTIGHISENDNDFVDALASLKSTLSLTDDQVATVLAASEVK